MSSEVDLQNSKIIGKVKHLLKLAKNTTFPEEAQSAMLKAQEFMAKHGLNMTEIEIETETSKKEVVDTNITNYTKTNWWEKRLVYLIAENFRCYSYINFRGGKSCLMLVGLSEDAQIAIEVYLYAREYLRLASKNYGNNYIAGEERNNARKSFIIGFLEGLKEKFEEQVEKNEWGLILVKDALVVEKVEEKKLGEARRSSFKCTINSDALRDGYEEGRMFGYEKNRLGA